jgi:starch synthase (maltosyl-transferring)
VVNIDPFLSHSSIIDVPLELLGLTEGQSYEMHDLLDGSRYTWRSRRNYVELDPATRPAHLFRARRLD